MAAGAVDREFYYIVLGAGLLLASFDVSLGSLRLSFWRPLGALWGPSWASFGGFWCVLGRLWEPHGPSWAGPGPEGYARGSKERFDCKFIWFGEQINSIA